MAPHRLVERTADVLHEHGEGERVRAEVRRDSEGLEYALCACGASILIGRDHGGKASIRPR